MRKPVKITVGYVLVPENINELYEVAKIVKEIGVDDFRIKCDISEGFSLDSDSTALDRSFDEIERVKTNLEDPNSFWVHVTYSKNDIARKKFKYWNCSQGCYFQHFFATIGSDGRVYSCVHNTMPTSTPLGNLINNEEQESFKNLWVSKKRQYLSEGIWAICSSNICPPFGNGVNPFLQAINRLKHSYGLEAVKSAITELRSSLS